MTRCWIDDGLVDPAAVRRLPESRLDVGDGVFETLLVRDGVPFALTRHLARLQRSLDLVGLSAADAAQVRTAVTAVIDDAGSLGTRARLRITVTAPRIDRDARTTLVVTLGPAPEWPDTTSIARVPWLRQDHSSIAGLKTTSYAQNSLALAVARRSGASEAVLADTAGRLCEGAGSNVFVVLDGEILTPDDSSGCLPGVTRGLVLEWAAQVAPVRAVPLPIGVLDEADEVFLTSSTREVHPVDRIDGRDRAVGDISHELRQLFRHNADAVVDP